MNRFANADAVYAWLNRYLNFERRAVPTEYRLDRMHAMHRDFTMPDRAYRVIHVAGSKGKGSTSTMLAAILGRAGHRVGLFTSPHLLSFTERIMVDLEPVDNDVLLPAAEELAAYMDGKEESYFPGGENPTYFELLTMLGFLCFRRAGCDMAVVEVGLGGRLDSTNVVQPELCAITPIELEHTELLGDTIAKIAAEKAGIMKPGVPVFTSAMKAEALTVFRARARELGCPLYVLDEEAELTELRIGEDGTAFTLKPRGQSLATRSYQSRMIGLVQARNASLAILMARSLGIADEAIRDGLLRAKLRARFEILKRAGMTVVLDGAHTEDSVTACAADFKALFPGGGALLFGCAKDKNPSAMAEALGGLFADVIITKPGTFKESDPPAMELAFAAAGFKTLTVQDTAEAIRLALERARSTGLPLLVTGSFYLCAEAALALG